MTDNSQDFPAPAVRQLAVRLFNEVWTLLGRARTPDEDVRMIHMAHASAYHWLQVGTPANQARGHWQCSRVYAVVGRAEPAQWHAHRALKVCQDRAIGDWDLAFCYEALASRSGTRAEICRVRTLPGRPDVTPPTPCRSQGGSSGR